MFLEPSENWGSGGHSCVRTGGPEQGAMEEGTDSFLLWPFKGLPIGLWWNLVTARVARPPCDALCRVNLLGTEQVREGQQIRREGGVGRWRITGTWGVFS